jgi:hypothetical protein
MVSVVMPGCGPFKAYQRAYTRGNEAATIMSLRKIAETQQSYALEHKGVYGSFRELVSGGALDERYNSDKPKVNDYVLTMTLIAKAPGTDRGSFSISADPEVAGQGARHFYLDSSGVIHVNATRVAGASDPVFNSNDPQR